MKKIFISSALIISAILLLTPISTLRAEIVEGTIGNGNYIDYEGTQSSGVYGLDFNNDGFVEFAIQTTGFDVEFTNCYVVYVSTDNGGNNIWAVGNFESGGWDVPQDLALNTSIGPNGNWEGLGDCSIVGWDGNPAIPLNEDIYLGFKIQLNNNYYYGWAKVNLTGSSSAGYTANWLQCAYNNTPNTPILAGSLANGIEDHQNNLSSIYPNPVTSSLSINLSNPQEIQKISICNILGGEILNQFGPFNEQTSINVSSLNSGIYFIRTYTATGMNTRKFIKK